MVKLDKIVTKAGDGGQTRLATGQQVSKADARVEAYGAVDETNSALGVARLHTRNTPLDAILERVQHDLFDLGADLAFLASGKYEEVRSAIVISGDAANAEALAKAVPDFQPHSILFIATQGDLQGASSAREFEKRTGFPVRVQIFENSEARGVKILQDIPDAATIVIDWLKKM